MPLQPWLWHMRRIGRKPRPQLLEAPSGVAHFPSQHVGLRDHPGGDRCEMDRNGLSSDCWSTFQVVAAVVGYGTNWVGVKMIFYPIKFFGVWGSRRSRNRFCFVFQRERRICGQGEASHVAGTAAGASGRLWRNSVQRSRPSKHRLARDRALQDLEDEHVTRLSISFQSFSMIFNQFSLVSTCAD